MLNKFRPLESFFVRCASPFISLQAYGFQKIITIIGYPVTFVLTEYDLCACQHTNARTLIPIHNLAFLCMLHNCEWELFLLSAHIVVNQGFIVAATAQSLQRQNKAFTAFVRSPLPVKMFHSLAFTSTSCSSLSLCLRLIEIIFSECLRCLPATEHLSWS